MDKALEEYHLMTIGAIVLPKVGVEDCGVFHLLQLDAVAGRVGGKRGEETDAFKNSYYKGTLYGKNVLAVVSSIYVLTGS